MELLVFYLICAHFLCDFSLQTETMAINKNKNSYTNLQLNVPYYYWLVSHSFIHGGAVAVITHSFWLGVFETLAHFYIDYCKCENAISIHVDQSLHVACKLLWVLILMIWC